jgi:septal ring factor EnvC (AmiA/AmiB activator)
MEEMLKEREKAVQDNETDLAKLGDRIAAIQKEKEDLDAGLKAATTEAAATATKLQAVELELQKAQVRDCRTSRRFFN